ncbi:uncharacterized protein LOC131880497 [Tigriopus californicus]|uniref:uncharacterized protein LOC131880497 n=1 Tax=Tigriopus californicus TaxID=6832 RepID=UPI0027DA563D|nr:uncharacterized protein LOC131880497 [Tigriopus californicus]
MTSSVPVESVVKRLQPESKFIAVSHSQPAMKLTSALVLCLLLVLAQGQKTKTYGRGLDRCKPFRVGCSMKHWDKAPFFIVNDFVEGDMNCSDYLPGDPNDIDIGDAHEIVLDACKDGMAQVRICVMKQKYMRNLVLDQDLRLSEMDDLDFAKVNLTSIKFQGKCWSCPDKTILV